ncbi:MAG: HAD-IIB family hydrolase [Bacilli bacterium]
MNKLIFFDLDDTLLRNDSSISDYTYSVIKQLQEKGHKIVINTARGLSAALLGSGNIKFDYLIADGGSLIINSKQELLFSDMMDIFTTNKFMDYLRETKSAFSFETVYGTETVSKERVDEYTVFFDINNKVNQATYKIVCEIKNYEDIIAVTEKLNLSFTSYYGHKWGRVNAKNVSKANGMIELCKIAGYCLVDTMAFGDDYGDISMMCEAGTGVVVSNGQKEALSAIKIHCLSNEEDGPAHYLEENLL